MHKVLIIGATGNLGRELVSQLLRADVQVCAMARRPESTGLPEPVEVTYGDLNIPRTIEECVEGVERVFLTWQTQPATVPEVIEKIASRVQHIVFLSNLTVRDDAETQDYSVTTLHANIERQIQASGASWTFLRPGAFATNARLWWGRQITAGNTVRWPYPDAATSPIHEADIASVAVQALCEEGHAGAKYILTGPESLTQRDQIRVIAEVLQRPLSYDEISPETFRSEMASVMPASIAEMLLTAWRTATGTPAVLTSTVEEITGAPARSFRQWAIDHAQDFQQS